jgi:hypothetical protein
MFCNDNLTRLQSLQSTSDETEYTADQLRLVNIKGNHIYERSTCRILYTTYDNRRASDTMNPIPTLISWWKVTPKIPLSHTGWVVLS